ncbi:MAG: glycosyltransferase family 2 protein [Nitrospirae bacterium]|nr:glycosyltransferase family 2 protein [Nitrospirota bacterium]
MWQAIGAINAIVLLYFVLLNTAYLITSLFAFGALRRYAKRMRALDFENLIASAGPPPITLIAPAFNEEKTCVDAVRSFLGLRYSDYDVLLVNDGSRDRTLDRMKEAFDLAPAARYPTSEIPTKRVRGTYRSRRHPNLWVIDKDNGGKADALNAGINFCRTPLYCAMDADSVLERDGLLRIVRPFMEDATTVAAGGIIRVVNGCRVVQGRVTSVGLPRKFLARIQVLEYLRAFLSGRMGWDAMDSTLIISGAFGLFKRGPVVEVGGYATDTVGEDMELVVRLHRYCREKGMKYKISFVPDPVAWTECPESIKQLARQRDRWQRGLMDSLLRHSRMLLNPRYGRIGLIAFPYFFFLEMLGPVIELGGYLAFIGTVALGNTPPSYVFAFLMVAVVFGVSLSIMAVGLEELSMRRYPKTGDLFRLFLLAFAENFGYRQFSTYWRVRGFLSSVRGVKTWGTLARKGFETERATA